MFRMRSCYPLLFWNCRKQMPCRCITQMFARLWYDPFLNEKLENGSVRWAQDEKRGRATPGQLFHNERFQWICSYCFNHLHIKHIYVVECARLSLLRRNLCCECKEQLSRTRRSWTHNRCSKYQAMRCTQVWVVSGVYAFQAQNYYHAELNCLLSVQPEYEFNLGTSNVEQGVYFKIIWSLQPAPLLKLSLELTLLVGEFHPLTCRQFDRQNASPMSISNSRISISIMSVEDSECRLTLCANLQSTKG